MIEGKTKSGFKFNIDERILDDWRVIEAIALSESSDPSEQIQGARQVADLILGKDKQKLIDFIAKKNNGFVPATAMISNLVEIITESKDLKNSPSS